jgi:ferredoxin
MTGPFLHLRAPWAALAAGLAAFVACQPDVAPVSVPRSPAKTAYPVEGWVAPGTGTVASQIRDHRGDSIGVACSTCHRGPVAPDASARGQPGALQREVKLAHGPLSCFSCHDRADRDRLHLADGATVAFADVVTLCRQCHAMQGRDFDHGAHGGMNGYWDLTRGPRAQRLHHLPRRACTQVPAHSAGVAAARPLPARQGARRPPMTTATASTSRRTLLKAGAATLGAAAFARALQPLTEWAPATSLTSFLQKHYKQLTSVEMKAVLASIERETHERTGRTVHVADPRPQDGVEFAYTLNLSICIGCRKCAEACHKDNNHDRATANSYIRVLEMDQGRLDLERGASTYTHAVPAPGKFYLPVQCQQCDNAPCVKVCPVEATWKEKTASWSSITTGASVAVIAKPPARTTRVASTGPNRRFQLRKSTRTKRT